MPRSPLPSFFRKVHRRHAEEGVAVVAAHVERKQAVLGVELPRLLNLRRLLLRTSRLIAAFNSF